MTKPGSLRTVVLLAGLAWVLAGPGAAAADKPFVFAILGKGSIPPLGSLEAYTTQRLAIEAQILEGLVRFDPQDPEKLLPNLAAQYFIIDPKTFVFRLRPDAFFHPFPDHPEDRVTAEDVKFSLDLARKSTSPLAYLLEDVDSIQTVGRDLVKIKLRQPNKSFLSILATSIGHVTSKQYYESLGRDEATRMAAFGQIPVGTGPYQLQGRLALGSKAVVLERFTGYRDRHWVLSQDAISQVEFRLYEEPKEIVKGILVGDIAMASLPLTSYADDGAFRGWEGTLTTLNPPFLVLLAINTSKERLRNPKIRQLLNVAVEKHKLMRICPSDLDELPASFRFYMEIPQEDTSDASDNDHLRRLLAQPGIKQSVENLHTSGPLTILVMDRPDHIVDAILASVAGDLKRNLGLDVRILRSPSVNREVVASLNPDLTYAEWTPDTPWEHGNLAILESLFKSTSFSNIALYSDLQVESLLADASRDNGQESTDVASKKIQARLRETAPLIWLPSVRHRVLLLNKGYQATYSSEVNGGTSSSLIHFTSLLKDVRRRP